MQIQDEPDPRLKSQVCADISIKNATALASDCHLTLLRHFIFFHGKSQGFYRVLPVEDPSS